MHPELDERRVDALERSLLSASAVRVGAKELWGALARVFPHRTAGPAERHLLLNALTAIQARGTIRLPPKPGKRWDRSMEPAVPTSVDVVRDRVVSPPFPWRSFPWHPCLHWVAQCRSLSAPQIEFLRRVHDGLVNGTFREPAPFKYRSLQLTGDEKMLASFLTTSLFAASRLTLETLACLPDAIPLAWESVGEGGRMVIFENAGPFAVARRVLAELTSRSYDLIAYGGGRGILASLAHINTIEPRVESIHYVGDLDDVGLDIAWNARHGAARLRLPTLLPATEIHRQMLATARVFGHADGWPTRTRLPELDRCRNLDVVDAEVRADVERILCAGRRIPEEILGPKELRSAWTTDPVTG
jgi:hypothetical protein